MILKLPIAAVQWGSKDVFFRFEDWDGQLPSIGHTLHLSGVKFRCVDWVFIEEASGLRIMGFRFYRDGMKARLLQVWSLLGEALNAVKRR